MSGPDLEDQHFLGAGAFAEGFVPGTKVWVGGVDLELAEAAKLQARSERAIGHGGPLAHEEGAPVGQALFEAGESAGESCPEVVGDGRV